MTDISNMGRCVVCGKPIDMQDEEHELVIMEQNVPDIDGITERDVREGMAEAIRRGGGTPQDHTLAKAYEDGEEIVMHQSCHDETALPDLYATEEQIEGLEG